MNRLAGLRAELADLKGRAVALLDRAEANDGTMTEADQAAYDGVKAEIAAKQAEIGAAERLAEERRQMAALTLAAPSDAPAPRPAGSMNVHDRDPVRTGGFADIAEFAVAVRNAMTPGHAPDRRLAALPGAHVGGAASGEGFLVPPEYSDRILDVVAELDEFGPLVDEEPTAAREVKMVADETTPWGAAGIQAYWRSEGSQMTPTKLALDPRTVPLHQLYALGLVTEELLEDAPRLAQRLTLKAGQAIAWKKNDAMIYGSGVGQPLGWFASAAGVTVAKENSQTATTIVVNNIIKMYSRLLRIPGDRPFWLVNSNCLPALMTLVVGDRPIWMPANGLADAPGGLLLGLPIRISEHARTVGAKGDIQLISPKGYYALRRESGPQYAESMHLYFDSATSAFRWTFRYGGQPHLSNPVSPANGADTKSHFVFLAERA